MTVLRSLRYWKMYSSAFNLSTRLPDAQLAWIRYFIDLRGKNHFEASAAHRKGRAIEHRACALQGVVAIR
jgi:hypothetical protein